MSVSQFENAIKNSMDNYSDTVKSLRNSEVMQRNSALAGLQSSMEKYGELAKLGLEIPVAVEGLKQVGGNVYSRANRIKEFVQGKANIQELISAPREGILRSIPQDIRVQTTLQSNFGEENSIEMGKSFKNTRNTLNKTKDLYGMDQPKERPTIPNIEEMQSRFDSVKPSMELRTISTNQPTAIVPGETKEGPTAIAPGETKEGLIQRQDNLRVDSSLESPEAESSGGKGLFSAAKDALGIGSSEEEIGAGLFSIPGIGEVLGGIMEGIGAITEATAVSAGAYGAVQSMMAGDKEEALREMPLAPIRVPTLDLGGSVGVPLMA